MSRIKIGMIFLMKIRMKILMSRMTWLIHRPALVLYHRKVSACHSEPPLGFDWGDFWIRNTTSDIWRNWIMHGISVINPLLSLRSLFQHFPSSRVRSPLYMPEFQRVVRCQFLIIFRVRGRNRDVNRKLHFFSIQHRVWRLFSPLFCRTCVELLYAMRAYGNTSSQSCWCICGSNRTAIRCPSSYG